MKPALLSFLVLLMLSPRLTATNPQPAATDGVQISQFSAARIQNLITLNWNTIGERNNFGFEIERKSQFEAKWQTVGYLRGRGTAVGNKGYAFVEKVTGSEVLQYRLKQIDISGSFLYSQAVTVTPDQIPVSMLVSPTADRPQVEYNRLSFALPTESDVHVTVHDVYGREVRTVTADRHLEAGFHVIPFGSSALPAGAYSVRLVTDSGTFVRTLVKS